MSARRKSADRAEFVVAELTHRLAVLRVCVEGYLASGVTDYEADEVTAELDSITAALDQVRVELKEVLS